MFGCIADDHAPDGKKKKMKKKVDDQNVFF